MPIEYQILDFAKSQWGDPSLMKLAAKLSEESGEVSGAVIRIEERRVEMREGCEALYKEVGDCLIVLSQIAAKRGWTLNEIRERRFKEIKERARPQPKPITPDDPKARLTIINVDRA